MKFEQLFSSSKGNAYVLTAANGKRLLIECGISWPLLQKALGYDLRGIEGCLITHEHKDHSKAVLDVMKAGIDVYGSIGTLDALGILGERKAWHAAAGTPYSIGPFWVTSYDISHDAMQPFMYVIQCDTESMLFATDTSHIKQRFLHTFDIIAIECSYNGPYLDKRVEEKTIDEEFAKRLLDSHMCESNCLAYLRDYCNLAKCREIHLLHLSADNINKDRIKREFEKKLFIEIKTVGDGKDVENIRSNIGN